MDREEERKVLGRYATDELFKWLTGKEQNERVNQYIDEGAGAALSGKIRLTASNLIPAGEEITTSDQLLFLTALRLRRSFGEDAPEQVYPTDTWAGMAAFGLSLFVDFDDLADRLLRKFVPEYVPSETHRSDDGRDDDE